MLYNKNRMYRQRPSALQNILASRIIFLIILILMLVVGVALGRELYRRYLINQEMDNIKAEIAKLEQKNLEINQLTDYLKTDDFVEREARLKRGLQLPGESIAVITGAQKSVLTPTEQKANLANPLKWFNYFFK